MKVSVVIPTFNRATLLERAIWSVFSQSKKVDEIIVIDDGSTDNTKDVIKKFPTLKYFYFKNQGVSFARNEGIKLSTNRWIAFLDSDDTWHKEKLALQCAYHEQNSDILISHTAEEWVRDGKIIKQKDKHKKPKGSCFRENLDFCKIAPSTVMIEKSLFDDAGLFDENLMVCEDYDLWLRILKRYPIGFVDQVLTTKYAGGHEQLSLSYFGMDRFRIEALFKHMPDEYVAKEIVKKLSILKKGAIKHQNSELITFCSDVEKRLNNF